MPWIGWIGELFILELTDILEKCKSLIFLQLPWQFSFIIEPSLQACLLPMVGFRSKRNVYIIQVNRKRWEFVSIGHSPNLQIKLSSDVLHCYIVSSKHGWEPIRARVTWVLFYIIENRQRVMSHFASCHWWSSHIYRCQGTILKATCVVLYSHILIREFLLIKLRSTGYVKMRILLSPEHVVAPNTRLSRQIEPLIRTGCRKIRPRPQNKQNLNPKARAMERRDKI